MDNVIKKRFPTDVNTEMKNTFLNDKEIDGELYAYLQSISYKDIINGENVTLVNKRDINKKHIAEEILGKSVRTVTRHMDILIEKGYLVEKDFDYWLPNLEETYLLIPVETMQFLIDTLKENVIKVYLYLGKKFKTKKNYEFTKKELMIAIGTNPTNSRQLMSMDNILICLESLGLIEYEVKLSGCREFMVLRRWSDNRFNLDKNHNRRGQKSYSTK